MGWKQYNTPLVITGSSAAARDKSSTMIQSVIQEVTKGPLKKKVVAEVTREQVEMFSRSSMS